MRPNQFLRFRDNHWHYKRRVPTRYAAFDDRGVVRFSLRTGSLDIARLRRDAQVQADDLFWASLIDIDGDPTEEGARRARDVAHGRYKAASLRALARGFTYASASELAERADIGDLVDRFRSVEDKDRGKPSAAEEAEAEAVLGGVDAPPLKISEAFDLYCEEIAIDELLSKSEMQKRLWKKTKKRGIQYFIDLVGDKPITSVTRQDARQYYNWWKDRLLPQPGKTPLSPNTANRDIGNVRVLFDAYFKHIGEEDRQNPFRNLSFKSKKSKGKVLPFEDEWVRKRILVPGQFDGINAEARHIMFALIETGCRPGEIGNLLEEDIILDHEVPHIKIRPKSNREIKTDASAREIPLIGVSLEAMKAFPKGFPRYRDKPDLLSANLMKAFEARKLFPSSKHKIYSFRHSFEKRMLEAGIDNDLRLTLMGHTNKRPAYGDGGSLAFRRDELLKIVHPFPEGVV
ncbi:MAG: tyrosine-type recombinase/integrase [Pseudomonadota bacterium]